MDVAAKLAEAQIIRVAVVDDDLSSRITLADLEVIEEGRVARLLNDAADPTREEYVKVLTDAGLDPFAIEDLAEPLADEVIRNAAPPRLRLAAEQVLNTRREAGQLVERVIDLLNALGIQNVNIDRYPTPQLPHDIFYDLLIVDYYLVDTRTDETLPFIKAALRSHEAQQQPLQVILMSSHDVQLKADFKEIRPKLEASSSRVRIMEKPKTDAHLVGWRAVLWQLASDRAEVSMLERFVREGGTALAEAATRTAAKLWELDVQALDLLHELASKDNDDYVRYVEDVISRRLLSELELDGGMRASLKQLDEAFVRHRDKNLLSPAAEIGDSRGAIHDMMHSMEWRDGVPEAPIFPVGEGELERSRWIRRHIRFGMVLLDSDGTKLLNITQACDMAQAADSEIAWSTVLLVRGQPSLPTKSPRGEFYVPMSAVMATAENHVITWNLRDVRAVSIQTFANTYGTGWQIVGELRPDKAQEIASKFGARTSRVGLPVTLTAWRLEGLAVRVRDLAAAAEDGPVPGLALFGHAIQRARDRGNDKPHELQLEGSSMSELLSTYGAALDESVAELLAGVSMKQDTTREIGVKAVCRYCAVKPRAVGNAREALSRPQLLSQVRNHDKVVIFLWSAT